MSKVKVSSWKELYDNYGIRTPDGVVLPMHLKTGQLDSKVRFHSAQANPYPAGANITPVISLNGEGIDNVQEI
jgi:hypothetical protein